MNARMTPEEEAARGLRDLQYADLRDRLCEEAERKGMRPSEAGPWSRAEAARRMELAEPKPTKKPRKRWVGRSMLFDEEI